MKTLKCVVIFTLFVMFSGCSYRVLDFTVISSKNHNLSFDIAGTGVKVEGRRGQFGSHANIKDAMDKAIESAGPGYDLLIDGVIRQISYPYWTIAVVTGTAVRSSDLKAHLGEEGFQEWLKATNVFDPTTAEVIKE